MIGDPLNQFFADVRTYLSWSEPYGREALEARDSIQAYLASIGRWP